MRLLTPIRIVLPALALVVAACSGNVNSQIAPTIISPTLAPATAEKQTSSPIPTVVTSVLSTSTPQANGTKVVWDYVALGDSNPNGFGVNGQSYVPLYADYLEQDLGIDVHLINRGVNGATSRSLLNNLQTAEKMRQDIQQAEVVTIDIGANDWDNVIKNYQDKKCGGADNQECLRDLIKAFSKNFDGILDEVTELQAQNETQLVRTLDLYTSNGELFDLLQNTETFHAVKPYVDEFNAEIEQATLAHHGQVVHLHTRFNGTDGKGNPRQFLQRDQDHLNPEGHKLVADMLRELGYTQ